MSKVTMSKATMSTHDMTSRYCRENKTCREIIDNGRAFAVSALFGF